MALQLSLSVRNARLDAVESTAGTAVLFRLYSGSAPVDCATAASGTLLASFALPSDWMSNAATGSKAKLGTWAGTGSTAGTAGYFRIYDSAGTNCHAQGSVSAAGGGGDLIVDSTTIASAQTITVTGFTLTDPNG